MQLVEYNERIGYIIAECSDKELQFLRDEVYQIKEDNFDDEKYHANNQRLASAIEHTYMLSNETQRRLFKIVAPLIDVYGQYCDCDYLQEIARVNQWAARTHEIELDIVDAWVNFQKKYEYNPPHDHTGAFSFVVWLDIPFTEEEELENPSVARSQDISGEYTANHPGSFNFIGMHHQRMVTQSISVDKKWRNRVCFFASRQVHYVLPFYTSDEHRITVSGNIFLAQPSNK